MFIEQILDDYDKAYDIKSVMLRYCNVIGADTDAVVGEWHVPESHLVPNILNSMLCDEKRFELYGDDYPTKDGTCVRDYINIEDLVDAHILALRYLENGGKTDFFNLGTEIGNTVKEVFTVCEKVTGKKIDIDIKSRREGDAVVLIADNQKAKNILGWAPKRSLEYSIETAYRWHKKSSKDEVIIS